MTSNTKKLLEEAQRVIIALKNELELEELQSKQQEKSKDSGEILSAEEVYKYFEISHPTLKRYRVNGMIKQAYPGHRKFYYKSDVIRLMKKIKPRKYSDWPD